MADDNKPLKYMRYAIGEVVLVVIGILIALQINNWNNDRITKQKEHHLLKELHNEFVKNKAQLDTVVFYHKRSYASANYMKSRLPIDIKNENLDSLAYNIFYMGWTYTFNPSRGTITAITNSASFDIISNDELRQLLISWEDVLSDYQEEEIRAWNNYQNHLKPYEKAHFLYSLDYTKSLTDPRIDLSFLKEMDFDNYVLDRYNDLNDLMSNSSGELKQITTTIDKIIELSKPDHSD